MTAFILHIGLNWRILTKTLLHLKIWQSNIVVCLQAWYTSRKCCHVVPRFIYLLFWSDLMMYINSKPVCYTMHEALKLAISNYWRNPSLSMFSVYQQKCTELQSHLREILVKSIANLLSENQKRFHGNWR